jgi:hypothetical protein
MAGSMASSMHPSTKTKLTTMSKEELQKFFKSKKKEMDEDAKSKMTQISRGTFKS